MSIGNDESDGWIHFQLPIGAMAEKMAERKGQQQAVREDSFRRIMELFQSLTAYELFTMRMILGSVGDPGMRIFLDGHVACLISTVYNANPDSGLTIEEAAERLGLKLPPQK